MTGKGIFFFLAFAFLVQSQPVADSSNITAVIAASSIGGTIQLFGPFDSTIEVNKSVALESQSQNGVNITVPGGIGISVINGSAPVFLGMGIRIVGCSIGVSVVNSTVSLSGVYFDCNTNFDVVLNGSSLMTLSAPAGSFGYSCDSGSSVDDNNANCNGSLVGNLLCSSTPTPTPTPDSTPTPTPDSTPTPTPTPNNPTPTPTPTNSTPTPTPTTVPTTPTVNGLRCYKTEGTNVPVTCGQGFDSCWLYYQKSAGLQGFKYYGCATQKECDDPESFGIGYTGCCCTTDLCNNPTTFKTCSGNTIVVAITLIVSLISVLALL